MDLPMSMSLEPVSFAPIERIFSEVGTTFFHPERYRLSNKMFETFRFVRCNSPVV